MGLPTLPALLAPEPGPATLKTRPWGGERLADLREAPASVERPIGESWEFSTLPGSESRSAGQPLRQLLGRPLPMLAKLIDAAVPLSVQVHPQDDDQAGIPGKEEAWIVLDATPGAVLRAGFVPGVDEESLARAAQRAIEDPRLGDDLLSLLQTIPALPGTVILVPAGTVHAIGGGVLLAEIQQPSDCTFRLFDYGSARALQESAGLAATRLDAQPEIWHPGSPPRSMRGKHLTLEILGPGHWPRRALLDELIVASGTELSLAWSGRTQPAPHGSMHLATSRLDYSIDVASGGHAIVGTCSEHVETS